MAQSTITASDLIRHQESFDTLYRQKFRENVNLDIEFPLVDIDRFVWNRGVRNDEYFDCLYKRFSVHILEMLQLQDARSILIIGCGFGFDEKNIRHLFPQIDIWSIDISEEMVSRAVENGSPGCFSIAAAEKLPFPDNSFDRILSREVIEHVVEPQSMLNEVSRVLKPAGIAVITTENEESLSPVNFYDRKIASLLRRIMCVKKNAPEYKDEAPTRLTMVAMAKTSGLNLNKMLYDGALYHFISQINKVFKRDIVPISKYLSCLENARNISMLFCDQAKYSFVKSSQSDTRCGAVDENVPTFVCTRYGCGESLKKNVHEYFCRRCKAQYPVHNGIVNFISSTYAGTSENLPAPDPSGTVVSGTIHKLLDTLYKTLNGGLLFCYSMAYFISALVLSMFVVKNSNIRRTRHIQACSPLMKYL